ncbi:MAG TPA: hypothetical protein VM100_05755 [Longimicrobiales bacterium]|nr:hypothetical protein [Longimicrobiales bacterium]
MSSCASTLTLSGTALTHIQNLNHTITATPPPASDFLHFEGDEQYVQGGLFHAEIYGIIEPHKDAATGALYDGKILARVHVDHDYRDYIEDKWNYWVVADTSVAHTKKWVSVWISAGDAPRTSPLTLSTPPHHHPHPRARWKNQSRSGAWTTCTDGECCCDANTCKTFEYFAF